MPTGKVALAVDEQDAGLRLDRFLALRLPGASRAEARRLIQEGLVRVDGRSASKGASLRAGSTVSVESFTPPGSWGPEPEPDLHFDLLYQDRDMVVVDKPPGVPCHPLRQGERGTVAGALVLRYPELEGVGPERREAGLVHRLDTGTSGVLVFARRAEAWEGLVEQVRGGGARKRYKALVEGDAMGFGTIDVPLATRGRRAVDGRRGDRMARGAKPAKTEVEGLGRLGAFTLVRATIGTGRRHQVRAHLALSGHPVAADRLYGAELDIPLGRPFLHALEIRLDSPSTGRRLKVRARLAADLEAVLSGLREEQQ